VDSNNLQSAIYNLQALTPPPWSDYELIDSGGGRKLERFGRYRLVRPEAQAIWSPALVASTWEKADAIFQRTQSDDGPGQWLQKTPLPEQWPLHYNNLRFWARLTPFRHTGIFPEHCAHFPWMARLLDSAAHQPNVLVLFGYTGLSTLYAAHVGARVCHVDASQPAVRWAKDNQAASGMNERPIRWIVDDVLKFLGREQRRGVRYDMVMMDPPVFGRGPKGEIWRLNEQLPQLVDQCRAILTAEPLGILINAYATSLSALTLQNLLAGTMGSYRGSITAGELVLPDSQNRPLSLALYARWTAAGL
jgi:23S rRNA (cytosine1962-C5)-methyltransferase